MVQFGRVWFLCGRSQARIPEPGYRGPGRAHAESCCLVYLFISAWLNRAFVWFSASTYLCLTRRALLHARLHQMSQAREKRSISAFLQSLARGAFCMCRAWTDRYVNQTKLCSCMWRAWTRTRAGNQTPPSLLTDFNI